MCPCAGDGIRKMLALSRVRYDLELPCPHDLRVLGLSDGSIDARAALRSWGSGRRGSRIGEVTRSSGAVIQKIASLPAVAASVDRLSSTSSCGMIGTRRGLNKLAERGDSMDTLAIPCHVRSRSPLG